MKENNISLINEYLLKAEENRIKNIAEQLENGSVAEFLANSRTRRFINRELSKSSKMVGASQKVGNIIANASQLDLERIGSFYKSDKSVKSSPRIKLSKDLIWIKENYGEETMHLCRKLFVRVLNVEGLLPKALSALFFKNRHLAEDVMNYYKEDDFASEVYKYIKTHHYEEEGVKEIFEREEKLEIDHKNLPPKGEYAKQLLATKGYTLIQCRTKEDLLKFKHYFAPGEELCSFEDEDVTEESYVWFAIKDGAENLNREDFKKPKRTDDYATSVISIQFTKGKNSRLKITNRYNHSVYNPDCTFDNNLNKIVPGLEYAFEYDYGVKEELICKGKEFYLRNYIKLQGKYYRYNTAINQVYYCDDNVIIDMRSGVSEIKILPPNQILVDYFIFDFATNTIHFYDNTIRDCFIETFGEIEKIDYKKPIITVKVKNGEDVVVELDSSNRIVSLKNNNVKECGNNFMLDCRSLVNLEMNNLVSCGNDFLYNGETIEKIYLPNLMNCGDNFMRDCIVLVDVDLPNLKECGFSFMKSAYKLTNASLPKLKKCRAYFLEKSYVITHLSLPELEECDGSFMRDNECLIELHVPKLRTAGCLFLRYNTNLQIFDAPNLTQYGSGFLTENETMRLKFESERKNFNHDLNLN